MTAPASRWNASIPAPARGFGAFQPSETFRWLADAHRSLLLGDSGRIAVALAALGLLALCLTGTALLARSLGGAGALLRPVRGGAARRWHGELGRLALAGLLLSSLTGVFLSATTFGLVPFAENPSRSLSPSGGAAAPVGGLAALAAVDVADLEKLTFPARNDPTDVFTLRRSTGEALVDPSTGAVLAFAPTSTMDQIGRWAGALHTGRFNAGPFSWPFALFLGLSTAAAPALGVTGFLMWRRRASSRVTRARIGDSETIVCAVASARRLKS